MPDLNNVLQAAIPLVFQENGKTALMVDLEAYRRSPNQKAYIQAVNNYIDTLDLLGSEKNKAKKQMRDVLAAGSNYERPLQNLESADAVTFSYKDRNGNDRGIVISDSSEKSMGAFRPYSWRFQISDADIDYRNFWLLEHERGHTFYGLEEAGSSRLATVETLIKYPESRAMLSFITDVKLADHIIPYELNYEKTQKYGHEVYQAMKDALNIPPEELERLRKMKPEDRRKFIAEESVIYDHMNEMYRAMGPASQPELMVRRALESKELGVPTPNNIADLSQANINTSDLRMHNLQSAVDTYASAKTMLQKNNPFDHTVSFEQSSADQMLHDFVDAMYRLTTAGYGQIRPQPDGKASTFTDQIADNINSVVANEISKPNGRSGVVFGEQHRNDEFPKLMAQRILPDVARASADRPKFLFVEWDRTPENLRMVDKFMRTGDPDVRNNLVFLNIDTPTGNSALLRNQQQRARNAWTEILDSARANGFTIMPYDEVDVSTDTLYLEELKKSGKTRDQLTDAEKQEIGKIAGELRIEKSNPVMVRNIQSLAPDNAVSVVVVGDDHARRPNDLPEMLGFSYILATDTSNDAPKIRDHTQSTVGAALEIELMQTDYDDNPRFSMLADAETAAVLLMERELPTGMGNGNMEFARLINQHLQGAGKFMEGKDWGAARIQLSEAQALLNEKFTSEQIQKDGYLSSLKIIIDGSNASIEKIAPEQKQGPALQAQAQFVSGTKPF